VTYNPMEMLKEFHDTFDPKGERRREEGLTEALLEKRFTLIEEEFKEVCEAFVEVVTTMGTEYLLNAAAHLAKELADLLYVIYGTAEECDIPIEKVFQEVHKSNMGKVWDDGLVHYRSDGKVLKPPTYSPPDIKKLMFP
jgi:predicted HAD superfamily Cof-like phosphohydrolase